jgi:hypothetical protein
METFEAEAVISAPSMTAPAVVKLQVPSPLMPAKLLPAWSSMAVASISI